MKKIIKSKGPECQGSTESRPTGEAMQVAYALVRPDPNQPRKSFSETSLKELADSIREQGIIQPLLLEFVPAKYRIFEPELHDKECRVEELQDGQWYRAYGHADREQCVIWAGEQNLKDCYQIICGERRWRAAGLAGLTELPAIVYRNLTQQQRFAFQFIENNQRENITALEEAQALKSQLEARVKADGAFSPEKLAVELGMSRASMYERLKLNRLHAPVREALLAGKISTSVAGEVAKLPTPKAQEQLLKIITNEDSYQFPYSVRDVQGLIDSDYVKQLNDAPFKLDNENLFTGLDPAELRKLPEGVCVGSCLECRARTGNMLAEFPELKSRPNVCTVPACFGEKCKAHWLALAKDKAQRGETVLTEKDFKRVKAEYVDAKREAWGLFDDEYTSPQRALGKHAPTPVLVSTAEGLKEYFKRTDLPAACAKAKVNLATEAKEKTQTPEQKAAAAIEQAKQEEMKHRRIECMKAQLPTLAKLLAKLKGPTAWTLALKLMENMAGYLDEDIEAGLLDSKIKDPQTRVLGRLFADEENKPITYRGDWEDQGLKLWLEAGIDLKKEFAASEKAAQPSLVIPKAEPKQKELPGKFTMSATNKARIAAASKARWAKVKANR